MTNLAEFADKTLLELLDEMGELNAERVQFVFGNEHDNPVAAVVVIRGPNTGHYLRAIEEEHRLHELNSEVQP